MRVGSNEDMVTYDERKKNGKRKYSETLIVKICHAESGIVWWKSARDDNAS